MTKNSLLIYCFVILIFCFLFIAPSISGPTASFPNMVVGDTIVVNVIEKKNGLFHKPKKDKDVLTYKVIEVNPDGSFVFEKSFRNSDVVYHLYVNNNYQYVKTVNKKTGVENIISARSIKKSLSFPLTVGKKWDHKFDGKSTKGIYHSYGEWFTVKSFEKISTMAGTFEVFKISGIQDNLSSDGVGNLRFTYWYSPKVKSIIKAEYSWKDGRELASYLSGTANIVEAVAITNAPLVYTLSVSSTPSNAKVYIDGAYRGRSPIKIEGNKGWYDLRIEKKGYHAITESIMLPNAGGAKSFALEKIEKVKITPPLIYVLSVSSAPSDAKVYIDGAYRGRSPIKIKCNKGWYDLKIEKKGYVIIDKTIQLPGDDEKQSFVFKKIETNEPIKTGKIFVNTTPGSSKVRVLNIKPQFYQGMELAPGKYHIEVNHKDYEIYKKWVTLNSDETKTMDIILNLLNNYEKSPEKAKRTGIIKKTGLPKDIKPPEIFLSKTLRGIKKVSKARNMIKGQAIDKSGVALVYVNNTEANLDKEGNFSANILLKPGENNVVIEAIDIHNNTANKTLKITREETFVQEKKISLIIGNASYVHGGNLSNPINDVKEMSKSLKSLGFEIMKYENVDQRTMKRAIDDFGTKLKSYDIGLFFYAGHGVQVGGYNFLIPIDAKLNSQNDVEYDCINVGRVLSKMENADNKTNILILDACRDNPFERSWMRGAKGKGLAFMNAPTGSLIAYATSPGKTASDGRNKNGLYTSALLEYIKNPKITALQMFQKVRKTVIEKSNGKQTPWESTSLTADFYFNK
jgi:hypothetical protein